MHFETSKPGVPRVGSARRGATAALTTLACAALISACGGSSGSSTSSTTPKNLNTARIAVSIEHSILAERHLTSKVVCPVEVTIETGKTFTCVATTTTKTKPPKTATTPFVVTIQNSRGYVTYEGK